MEFLSDPTRFFPSSYRDSRERFLKCCDAQQLVRVELPYSSKGSEGQVIAMDVAWCGAEKSQAGNLLILSSGLHGLEGPLGAACQLAALHEGRLHRLASSKGWAVLIVHALNPFGFAAHRRWDDQNIDVNRNFWLESDDLDATSNIYEGLNAWLNPQQRLWHDPVSFYVNAVQAIRRHGFAEVKQAIAEGQFQFPNGLFYGGRERSWTRTMLEEHLPQWIEGFPFVAHLDVHSGLGKWQQCKLLLDYPIRPSQQSYMQQRHPEDAWEQASAEGTAYKAVGGLGRWCHATFSDHDYLYLCAEVGTYGPMQVLKALRLENQQWHHEGRRTPQVMRRVREMFCPRSRTWRTEAVHAVWRAIVRTVTSP